MSEQCEQMSERTSEWPSTCIWIFDCAIGGGTRIACVNGNILFFKGAPGTIPALTDGAQLTWCVKPTIAGMALDDGVVLLRERKKERYLKEEKKERMKERKQEDRIVALSFVMILTMT